MRFAFTDDQLLFRDAVRDLFEKECPPSAVRVAWENETGTLPEVWRALADMGVIGALQSEADGGLGLTELDVVLLAEEAGRVALPGPLVESAFVAAPLLTALGAEGALLVRLASGEATAACAIGPDPFVSHAATAEVIVGASDGATFLLGPDRAALVAQPSVDGARRLFTIEHAAGDRQALADAAGSHDALDRARRRGALLTSAQLLGVAQHLLDVTVEYVGEREQFGVKIGSFQAVKHHLADALLQLEFARPVVYRAAYSMAHDLDTASRDVSMAKCYASDAATLVARKALQCHGAIAYTVEYDLHLWLKRVWALAAAWGDAAHHRALVARDVLGA